MEEVGHSRVSIVQFTQFIIRPTSVITHRDIDGAMTHQLTDCAKVGSLLQKPSCKSVAQTMGTKTALDTCFADKAL